MIMNPNRQNSGAGRGKIRVSAIAVALMAMLLPACQNDSPNASLPGEAGNITTEEVAEDTGQLLGSIVTVRSEPVEKVGDYTFTVSDEEWLGGETILVVNASGQPTVLPAQDDTELQITGTVARFVALDIERAYGLDLDPNLYAEYEGKPALIARSIAISPEPGEISQNPSVYYGRVLAVPGEVEDIVGPNSFTLDEEEIIGANDLLVVVPTPRRAINDGEKVVATGVLRPFVLAELEREYDFTWDLDVKNKLEVEYREKPVLVADDVYPSAVEQ